MNLNLQNRHRRVADARWQIDAILQDARAAGSKCRLNLPGLNFYERKHERIKTMQLDRMAEEILESLWIETVEEGSSDCDVTVLSEDASLGRLVEDGYVDLANHKASLTEKGREAASGCVRRHRLAERLLVDVLDMKGELVHETGCEFEHLLHKGLDQNICTLLGHPGTCPHGKPIPQGECCREAAKQPGKVIVELNELEPGRKATVAYLQTHNKSALQKLIAMDLLPKTELTLLQRKPTPVVQVSRSQFALDKELASHVFVRNSE
jgi:DtxR family Mn-dependent transcriptional regulator